MELLTIDFTKTLHGNYIAKASNNKDKEVTTVISEHHYQTLLQEWNSIITDRDNSYKYVVRSDIDDNNVRMEFDSESKAIKYAQENRDLLTWVDKVLFSNSDEYEYDKIETVWSFMDE